MSTAENKELIKMTLAELLVDIEKHDLDYAQRYPLVLQAMALAATIGYAAGVRFDSDPAWPVYCIDLPGAGEVSWHCPAYNAKPYDGYDTAEKYRRCRGFAASVSERDS